MTTKQTYTTMSIKSEAVRHLTEAQYEEKNERIRKILDDAGKLLEAENVKYFLGVLDRRPETEDQGKAFAKSDVTGEDFTHILDMALPTRKDAINLGIYVGHLIKARAKNKF